jgi:hypothetical protein
MKEMLARDTVYGFGMLSAFALLERNTRDINRTATSPSLLPLLCRLVQGVPMIEIFMLASGLLLALFAVGTALRPSSTSFWVARY